jgi:beta-galactosidase
MSSASSKPSSPAGNTLAAAPRHTFSIGQHDFLLDGDPFVIRCGEIHYARVPREYWRHRLQMCRAMGLNTVCVYLFWNFHEWEEGRFDWTGQGDVAEFCRLAQAEGLWVLLRPGPYSCAEWEMGGLPWWLVKHDHIQLRSADPLFLEPALRFLREVGRVLGATQITRGGPLLMVQVENEYGSYGDDAAYMGAIRQGLIDAGFDVPLFACNPSGAIANGYREDLFQVVNFGIGAADKAFETLRGFQKTGPLMNGEYYPAWFDTWGRKHRTGDVAPIAADLDHMVRHRHSFSIYMAHGGTSFGFWAGADRPFSPDTSSYDYDAPISEAGWVTPKFTGIREVFARHLQPGETLPEPPLANPVIEIPPLTLTETALLLQHLPSPKTDAAPRHMEAYNQSRGCILYRTTLPAGEAGILEVRAVHDFAWIFVNGRAVGVMDRRGKRFKVELPERSSPAQLDILIEAVGRVNFGREVFDRKGLHGPVQWLPSGGGPAGDLKGWEVFSLSLDDEYLAGLRFTEAGAEAPAFWRGRFEVQAPGDTFLDLRSWGKGMVWVNGHCLGRFWNIGPTQTMYLPGPWLRSGVNEVVVLDLLGPRKPVLAGLARPILDQLRPELDFAGRRRASGEFDAGGLAPAAEGSFTDRIEWQTVRFKQPAAGRFVCLEALNAIEGEALAAVAELDVVGAEDAPLSKSGWKIFWVDSEDALGSGSDAENILDGQPSSCWQTEHGRAYPHRVIVDLGECQRLMGIRYLPRSGNMENSGRIREYRVYVSDLPFNLMPPPDR